MNLKLRWNVKIIPPFQTMEKKEKMKINTFSNVKKTGGIVFISDKDEVLSFGDIFERFLNLPLEKQKEIIDDMDKQGEY